MTVVEPSEPRVSVRQIVSNGICYRIRSRTPSEVPEVPIPVMTTVASPSSPSTPASPASPVTYTTVHESEYVATIMTGNERKPVNLVRLSNEQFNVDVMMLDLASVPFETIHTSTDIDYPANNIRFTLARDIQTLLGDNQRCIDNLIKIRNCSRGNISMITGCTDDPDDIKIYNSEHKQGKDTSVHITIYSPTHENKTINVISLKLPSNLDLESCVLAIPRFGIYITGIADTNVLYEAYGIPHHFDILRSPTQHTVDIIVESYYDTRSSNVAYISYNGDYSLQTNITSSDVAFSGGRVIVKRQGCDDLIVSMDSRLENGDVFKYEWEDENVEIIISTSRSQLIKICDDNKSKYRTNVRLLDENLELKEERTSLKDTIEKLNYDTKVLKTSLLEKNNIIAINQANVKKAEIGKDTQKVKLEEQHCKTRVAESSEKVTQSTNTSNESLMWLKVATAIIGFTTVAIGAYVKTRPVGIAYSKLIEWGVNFNGIDGICSKVFTGISSAIIVSPITYGIGRLFDYIVSATGSILPACADIISDTCDVVSGLFSGVSDVVSDTCDVVSDVVSSVCDVISDVASSVCDAFNSVLDWCW